MRKIKVNSGKTKFTYLLALIFLTGLILAGYNLFSSEYKPVDINDKTVKDIVIPEHSSAREIAKILVDNDLIHSERAFLSYCRRMGYDSKLKAGHYQFSRSQSLKEIVQVIAEGKVVTITFTIPEGYTVQQIGEFFVTNGLCTKEDWDKAVNLKYDFDFLPYDNNKVKHPLEGFLFPDTYKIGENTSAQTIIKTMLNRFDKVWNQEFAVQARKMDRSVFEVITIASMVEKEAMVADERPTIAGVIENRLKKNMPLQIDATVIYALGSHKEKVYNIDLTVDSPYNTYKYGGLPAGPIASPGKAAIEAALFPQKHDYLYYVARGDGSHYFSKTYQEHLQAKAQYID